VSDSSIEQGIKDIIADVAGVDAEEIGPETDLTKDLDIDSIKAIEITVAIEKKFKVSVRDEDVPKIMTLQQAVALVGQLLAQKNAANVKN
jgi:acyl carrier protein